VPLLFVCPSFISDSTSGISVADSGIVSVMTALFFLTSSSLFIYSVLPVRALGLGSSSMLKLVLLFVRVDSLLFSFLRPS
jgi:hypothetical protein